MARRLKARRSAKRLICGENSQASGRDFFVCILLPDHEGKHKDAYENTWSVTVNGRPL